MYAGTDRRAGRCPYRPVTAPCRRKGPRPSRPRPRAVGVLGPEAALRHGETGLDGQPMQERHVGTERPQGAHLRATGLRMTDTPEQALQQRIVTPPPGGDRAATVVGRRICRDPGKRGRRRPAAGTSIAPGSRPGMRTGRASRPALGQARKAISAAHSGLRFLEAGQAQLREVELRGTGGFGSRPLLAGSSGSPTGMPRRLQAGRFILVRPRRDCAHAGGQRRDVCAVRGSPSEGDPDGCRPCGRCVHAQHGGL